MINPSSGWKSLLGKIFALTRTIYFVFGLVIGLVANALSIPKILVDFSSNFGDAQEYFYNLIYTHSNWNGIFDEYPEGMVNIEELGLSSSVNAALEIEVVDGNLIDGRIWWIGACDFGSPYQGLLLDGRIRVGGRIAEVEVYDFYDGHRLTFLTGRLVNDGLIVEFENFPGNTGLNGSRIAKNPEPASLENWGEIYCR